MVEENYNSNVEGYNSVKRSPMYRHFAEHSIIKSISPNSAYSDDCLFGMKILDLGCGSGRPTAHMLEKGASEVICVDISQGMIDDALNLISNLGFEPTRYSFLKGDCFSSLSMFEALPLEKYENYFDAIIGVFLICYAETIDILADFWKICNKLLKVGGKVSFISLNPILQTEFETYERLLAHDYIRIQNLRVINNLYVCDIAFAEKYSETINFIVQNRFFTEQMVNTTMARSFIRIIEAQGCDGDPKLFENGYISDGPLNTPGETNFSYLFVGQKERDL